MSATALAAAAGLTKSHLSQVEQGKIALPNADIRRRIAKALGVSHLDLLVAAGEITEDEITRAGAVSTAQPTPLQEELIDLIMRVNWQPDGAEFAQIVLRRMSDEERR